MSNVFLAFNFEILFFVHSHVGLLECKSIIPDLSINVKLCRTLLPLFSICPFINLPLLKSFGLNVFCNLPLFSPPNPLRLFFAGLINKSNSCSFSASCSSPPPKLGEGLRVISYNFTSVHAKICFSIAFITSRQTGFSTINFSGFSFRIILRYI